MLCSFSPANTTATSMKPRLRLALILASSATIAACSANNAADANRPAESTTDNGPDFSTSSTETIGQSDGNGPSADTAVACPGSALCECKTNTDCDAGICIPTASGKNICAPKCEGKCPDGFECATLSGADLTQYCVPKFVKLCDPCNDDAACQPTGLKSALCVAYGPAGNFCGAACAVKADCQDGYDCLDSTGQVGQKGKQCVKKDGICGCSGEADLKTTTCFVESKVPGDKPLKCKGQRTCSNGVLAACLAEEATAEKGCDGIDNDCNGQIDEVGCDDKNDCTTDSCKTALGTAIPFQCVHAPIEAITCDDGSKCTENDVCAVGACKPGNAKDCDDKNPCTDDKCDSIKGCIHLIGDGNPCDDSDTCTVGDTCAGGTCSKTFPKCPPKGPCDTGVCDPANGKCSSVAAADGVGCDDANPCTMESKCTGGNCIGSAPVICAAKPCQTGVCSLATGCVYKAFDSGGCDDGDACTLQDACSDGTCIGKKLAAEDCSDGNGCTTDTCAKGQGCIHSFETTGGNKCEDGNTCTVGDECVAGVCKPGAKTCVCVIDSDCVDDGNPCNGLPYCVNKQCEIKPGSVVTCDKAPNDCNVIACSLKSGKCDLTVLPDTKACEDGDKCTVGDQCKNGQCLPGGPDPCNDNNDCTLDACAQDKGCSHDAKGGICSDGSVCTTGDVCKDGACVGTPIPDSKCDDKNVCTADACDAVAGCVHGPNKAVCDDGNACNGVDKCDQGACVGDNSVGACTCKLPEKPCVDDGNLCNGSLACVNNQCQPGQPVLCDASVNTVCKKNLCDPSVGKCQPEIEPDGKPCDADGSLCTTGDHCSSGSCVAGINIGCDDGNPCTQDSCDGKLGCQHSPVANSCDDGVACTLGDKCAGGVCVGGPGKNCDDGNSCTTDSCVGVNANCSYLANAGPCSDGNACTIGDVCSPGSGACKAGAAVVCDDQNPCTADSCDPVSGCKSVATAAPCNDGDACTNGDACSASACVPGPAIKCDDANPCTLDTCDKVKGCANAAQPGACDDGNSCTKNDACSNGKCVGIGQVCDDGNACTDDGCDANGGCVYAANAKPCDDGNTCTVNDLCGNKGCKSGAAKVCTDGNPCTDDSCDPAAGCKFPNNVNACDDGSACTLGDLCGAGKCVPGSAKVCNDSNVCTVDSCDPSIGCKFAAVGGACDDGNACTLADACSGGLCVGGNSQNCDDNNPCTTDSCSGGCKNVNNSNSCSDNNACTNGDKCGNGSCGAGGPVNCDDGNVCTNDSCDAVQGCQHGNNANGCSDNSVCTSSDKCSNGSCGSGGVVNCDDGIACTNDSCDAIQGCLHVNNSNGCNDFNACTSADKCSNGSCGGVAVNCDDGKVCTTDSCDPVTGCKNMANNASCDDGNACTVGDVCSGGSCQAGGAKDCSGLTDTCNTGICSGGGCIKQAKAGACDDGNTCTGVDQCSGGSCSGPAKADYTNCGGSNECHSGICAACGGTYQPCCGGSSCNAGNLCISGTCDPEPASTVERRYSNCQSAHWQAPDECFPGKSAGATATTGCGACATGNNYCGGAANQTCWGKESSFISYNSQPVFGSFGLVYHCYVSSRNRYQTTPCGVYGTPQTLGYVAKSSISIWNKPLYLCQWQSAGVTEDFFTMSKAECSGVSGSLLVGFNGSTDWAYVP